VTEKNMQLRTHTCGELGIADVNNEVRLAGWVKSWRDHGSLLFIDLRDRYGVTQIVFNPQDNPALHKEAMSLRTEFVISVKGKVQLRPEGMRNKNMDTGDVEVNAESFILLNTAQTTPFEILDEVDVHEELKLKYRYLDLRRPTNMKNLLLRSQLYKVVRDFLHSNRFVEIETPFLMKSTPEGARDFLVPSRNYKGKFYALPQSPQTYKQILMIAGFDRYFQIVKCFRDEDFRRDRQPEFTQIDMEMSFVDEKDVMDIAESLVKTIFREIKGYEMDYQFPHISYAAAMHDYGSDKPDLRFGMKIIHLSDVFKETSFKAFSTVLEDKGIIAGLCSAGADIFSRNQIDRLTEFVKQSGAKGLIWFKFKNASLDGPVAKFMSPSEISQIIAKTGAAENNIIFLVAGEAEKTLTTLGNLRLYLRDYLKLEYSTNESFLWVTDFPMLEFNEEENRYVARHHPFTSPKKEDINLLESAPRDVKARAYDLVMNGSEVAGGSIRIHQADLQQRVFRRLGISDVEAEDKFGFLLTAMKYGAPPHGGIAFGLDRLVMLLAGAGSIRDVIAFPKTTSALSLMDGAPSGISTEQLAELGLSLVKKDAVDA
jgi:aspartyl-tRNA synthetase